MKRKLVVCCDGTYNVPGQADSGLPAPTNVWKVCHALQHDPSSYPGKMVRYFRGVGRGWAASIGWIWRLAHWISFGRLDHLFGGVSGWGLSRQIRDAYTFLAEEYEEGDEIYVFGFSRGAFAARSLVGLIRHAGLPRKSDRTLIRKVAKAYHRLRRGRQHREYLQSVQPLMWPGVRVRFLGVWDTVRALGLPVWGGNFSLNPLPLAERYHDVNALDVVDAAYHALAIDDQRAAFAPVLFRTEPGRARGKLEQVWFRGAHCDVGGGYADCRLSDIALRWMVERASEWGLDICERDLYAAADSRPVQPRDSLGQFWVAGVWPRWFPVASTPEASDYNPDWGYLHPSVSAVRVPGEARPGGEQWLEDLIPGEESPVIEIHSGKFWENTHLVLRSSGRYVIRAEGNWDVAGHWCSAEGEPGSQRLLRAPNGRTGELVLVVNAPPTGPLPKGRLWDAFAYLFRVRFSPLVRWLHPWGTLLSVNGEHILEPELTGVLHCFANCAVRRQSCNTGELRIRVARVA